MAVVKNGHAGNLIKDAIVLDLGDLRRQGDEMVQQARAQAQSILDDAEAEARRRIDEAADKGREQGLAESRAEGLEEGRRAGREEALAAAGEQLERLTTGWTDALNSWTEHRGRMLLEAREDVLALAIAITERLVHRSIEVDPSIVVDQVAEALSMVSSPSAVTLAVHPEDAAFVEEALPELSSALSSGSDIELVTRDSVDRGGCVVSTRGGAVDARISRQIERIVETLLPAGRATFDNTARSDDDDADDGT